jgi:hypothetical protein
MPVQMEAKAAAKRSSLSVHVEYENILKKCKKAVLCSAVLKAFFLAGFGAGADSTTGGSEGSEGTSGVSGSGETGRVADVEHGVCGVFSPLLVWPALFAGE